MAINKTTKILKSSIRWIQTTQNKRSRHFQSTEEVEDLSSFDPIQVKHLDEMCIEVDEQDRVIGPRTKKDCHLIENIDKGLIHRAFCVFLFNTKGEILLQQRSDRKILFPGYYSNTCCGHPLYNDSEREESQQIGVKRAAQRRLHFELGISPDSINIEEFHCMTRIIHTKPFDEQWGEKEIFYLLFVQKDVEINLNSNEVKDSIYLSKEKLIPFLDDVLKKGFKIVPWLYFVTDKLLNRYWDNLENLKPLRDHKIIHGI